MRTTHVPSRRGLRRFIARDAHGSIDVHFPFVPGGTVAIVGESLCY